MNNLVDKMSVVLVDCKGLWGIHLYSVWRYANWRNEN